MILLKNRVDLINVFRKALAYQQPVALFITLPDYVKPELIINQYENLEKKLEYYLDTYDNNTLVHKHAPGVKIVGYTVTTERW